jgi:DNA topoisomerase III
MKTLILTEKPSVAKDFAKALNIKCKGVGFYEDDQYILTWAIGHLLELKSPHEYCLKWKKWSLETLPILPERLSYKVNYKTKKQFFLVNQQLRRKDISQIIVATDAGREGELIARTLLENAKINVPCTRFWTSEALSTKVILHHLSKVKPLSEYDRLYFAGRARQSSDWMIGMNLTRIATIKLGDLFSVGRVQTAVLSMLAMRRKEIDKFAAEKYYLIKAKFRFNTDIIQATWFQTNEKDQSKSSKVKKKQVAESIIDECGSKTVKVKEVIKKRNSHRPPQLLSLTELQRIANIKYGFSAKKTLSIAQDLYEKNKCLSYPRTDARVLGDSSLPQVREIIKDLKKFMPEYYKYLDDEKVSLRNKLVFNDAKLTDHHALIPLKKFNGDLKTDHGKIFDLVLRRFLAAFSANYIFESTTIIFNCDKHLFKADGKKILSSGWTFLVKEEVEQKIPLIIKGDEGNINEMKLIESFTLPPAEYTEASLLGDMVNPARLVEQKEYKQLFRGEVGLGTQATRAQIIETLIKRNYVKRNKKNLIIQDKGIYLIQMFQTLSISKELTTITETAKWELELDAISQGIGNVYSFMSNIREYVSNCVQEWKEIEVDPKIKAKIKQNAPAKSYDKKRVKVGDCPICKGVILSNSKSYSCSNWKKGCSFSIWKSIASAKITPSIAKQVLSEGKTKKTLKFTSKQGKSFEANLVLRKNKVEFLFNNY